MLINRKDSRIRGMPSEVQGKLGRLSSIRFSILRLITLVLILVIVAQIQEFAPFGANGDPEADNLPTVAGIAGPNRATPNPGSSNPDNHTSLPESSAVERSNHVAGHSFIRLNAAGTNQNFGIGINSVIKVGSGQTKTAGNVSTNSQVNTPKPDPKEEDDLIMPEWQKIISPEGFAIDVVGWKNRAGTDGIPDYQQLYPAFEAGFIEEVLSNGIATDMSALLVAREVQDEVLYNGAVSAAHDLGNAFYMLSLSKTTGLRLYAGVERLRSDLPTFIEFELNQVPVEVGSGIPWWHIQGTRQDGDMLVRFNLMAGTLTSIELAVWQESYFQIFESDTRALGNGCRDQFSYSYCIGPPSLNYTASQIEVWDEDYIPVEPTLPDSFVQLGLDFNRILQGAVEYSSLYIRTPEDVVFTSFQKIGRDRLQLSRTSHSSSEFMHAIRELNGSGS